MTSRERVIKTLRFESPDRAPRQVWALPGVWFERPEEIRELEAGSRWTSAGPRYRYGESRRAQGESARVGRSVDAWGSVWEVMEEGRVGEVKEPALADWADLERYELPWELLREADLSEVNASCAASDLFIIGGGETRPFERMQFLAGHGEPVPRSRLRDAGGLSAAGHAPRVLLRGDADVGGDGRGRRQLHGRLGERRRRCSSRRTSGAASTSRCTRTTATSSTPAASSSSSTPTATSRRSIPT